MKKTGLRFLLILSILIAILFTASSCLIPGFAFPQPDQPTSQQQQNTDVQSTPIIAAPTPIAPAWTPSVSSSGSQPMLDMSDVVAKVRPSVVSIDVKITAYDMFNQPYTESAAGTGWIIDSNGVIVTNNHVVENAKEINITLADGRTFPFTSVSTDPVSDLAVVKIDATGLPAAKLGDSSQLKVGQMVAAIGNALGEGISMTGGWVSQLGVSMTNDQGITLYDLIKTDAAINPGNSGGPLVNTAGEVVGITSAKLVGSSIEGVGYAISTKTALPIITDLITKGYTVRPWFGISLQTMSDSIAARYNLAVGKGAVVTSVTSNSPASLAGLKQLDVIVAIGDSNVNSLEDAIQAIRSSAIGKAVQVQYYRGKSKYTTTVTPAEAPRQ